MTNYRFFYHIVALLVASIWGSTFISTKLLLLAGMTAAQIFVLRFAIAYVLLLGYSVYKRHRVFARSWRHELLLAMLGVVGGSLYFLTENSAMNYTTTTNTSIIVSLCPLFASALIGFVYKSQRLNRVQTFGTLLAAAGVVVVVMNGRFVLHLSPLGDTLAFMACLCWAFYSLLMIPASKRYDTVFITRKVFFYGLVSMIPYFAVYPGLGVDIVVGQPRLLANLLFVARNIHTLSASVAGIPEKSGSRAAAAGLPEMQALADQVNDMLARIDQANTASAEAHQKVYEATLAKQSAQMAFYRSQIDPHFLFNTLECMRSMAQHYGVSPLEEMIGSTNQLLRYSLHAPFIVTLREELEAASAYMRVMNQRTMERYRYDLRVEEALLQRPVLSMLLQPLMENAVRHGARHMGKRQFVLTLEVTADAGNDDTVLRLTDNGCGIPSEMILQLNADITEDHDGFGESIGVRNLRRRLAATDSRCTLRFESQQDVYTTVTVRLPRSLALPAI